MTTPLAITMGDPSGIGPEVTLRAVAKLLEDGPTGDLVVYGDPNILTRTAKISGLSLARINIIATSDLPAENPLGRIHARSGEAAFAALRRALDDIQVGRAAGVVTAPISKEALNLAGHKYPGHTEILAEAAGGVPVRMMLANLELAVVLVTIHEPLKAAIDRLTASLIEETIRLTDAHFRRFEGMAPRIAVAGLNPHAGEGGLLGNEENTILAPAIDACRADGIEVSGPFAPDTVFMRTRGFREFDVAVAQYHDQGLIPVKYLGIDNGVNVTVGLPFVRTSPDHGTAFDIAGTGRADPTSMVAAIRRARRYRDGLASHGQDIRG